MNYCKGSKEKPQETARRLLAIMLVLVLVATLAPIGPLGAESAQAKSKTKTKYWLKVNRQRNVITAYKKVGKKWKPQRAMLCSTGTMGRTPRGTFNTKAKYRWKVLMGGVWGQYSTTITPGYLFHSVWYNSRSRASQSVAEFNKLGRAASHGCVRVSTIDAKWIYDNCKVGTKVTIYDSSKAGPLGKPKAIRSSSGWDPTDPTKGNPNFKLRKATIKISKNKKKTVAYGAKYKLTGGVKAKNPNANENITDRIKVSVKKKSKGKWVKAKFDTQKPGTYKVTYKIKYKYCKSAKKTITIKVKKAKKKAETGTSDASGAQQAQ